LSPGSGLAERLAREEADVLVPDRASRPFDDLIVAPATASVLADPGAAIPARVLKLRLADGLP
jgi:NAD(P)-dependent dehydrogenase (short-subunit alcohol dehydrogenase family)